MHLRDQPFPEVDRLGVRVVDPEHGDRRARSRTDDPQHLGVDTGRVVVEVDRIDVLVLLRRVLGVGDRSVGPGGEPLRVFGDPRVVRRALQGKVQSHLQAEILGRCDEVVEVLDACPTPGAPRRGRPRPSRSPTANRHRRGSGLIVPPGSADCCGPCGSPRRSGGSAAGRRCRNPSARSGAVQSIASAKVPCRNGSRRRRSAAPEDRGKNSYQEPNSASGRSTQTCTAGDRVINSRIGSAASTGHRSPDSAGPIRSATADVGVAQRGDGSLDRGRVPLARAPADPLQQQGPGLQVVGHLLAGLPGGGLGLDGVPPGAQRIAPGLDHQAPQPLPVGRDLGVETVGARSPGTHPEQRAGLGGAALRLPVLRRPTAGGFHTTFAATASCPSRNTVAPTSITAPTTALAGYRPPATLGDTSINPIRPATRNNVPAADRSGAVAGPPRDAGHATPNSLIAGC